MPAGGEIAQNSYFEQLRTRLDWGHAPLAHRLLQNCMVFVNTLILQQVLARPHWADRLTPRDQQAITPLIWDHVNPYGRYERHEQAYPDPHLSPNGGW